MKHQIVLLLVLLLVFSIGCHTQRKVTHVQDAENSLIKKIYKNIKIIESNAYMTGSCEPSIAINPSNPKNIVAGNVLNDYHYSFDGGLTWTSGKLHSKLGVYGDPCIIADNEGSFYYLHLANPDGRAFASKKFLNQIVRYAFFFINLLC